MAAEIFTEYEIVNPLKMHKIESNKSRQFEQDGENIYRIKLNFLPHTNKLSLKVCIHFSLYNLNKLTWLEVNQSWFGGFLYSRKVVWMGCGGIVKIASVPVVFV